MPLPARTQPVTKTGMPFQPVPRMVNDLRMSISMDIPKDTLFIRCSQSEAEKAAAYLQRIMNSHTGGVLQMEILKPAEKAAKRASVFLNLDKSISGAPNDQFYAIQYSEEKNEITISAPGPLGLLYGVATFSQCVSMDGNQLTVHLYDIKDWPAYQRRIFVASPRSSEIDGLLDFALRNKMETIALASRRYSWNEVDNEYEDVLSAIKKWEDRFGGPHIMQSHNIYAGKKIEISNPDDIAGLKKVIEAGITHGADKLMILADDLAPFKFDDGYVLTSAKDKEKFGSMAEAHCYLLNELREWMHKKSYTSELYYVPPFYCGEDMYYGDMELYKDTPWENDAFGPLKRDLKYIGLNLSKDIFVIWSGPNVRSRTISINDLSTWSAYLQGTVPFLWDNTIYSHHPFTTTALFSAYSNTLPVKFDQLTAGNGMFINGDANSEGMKIAMVTANDFLWNPDKYDAENSLRTAMVRRYGRQSVDLLLNFRDAELELRKKIGERALWFEADTLWDVIRKAKALTGKNPFYYHLNYSRLKALRLQLKYSVPEPESKAVFMEECRRLAAKRDGILDELKNVNTKIYEYLKSVSVALPDTGQIQ